jgi:hypothetical protein
VLLPLGQPRGSSRAKEQDMKFKKEWPTRSGYYWYVDIAYPSPLIGFIQGHLLHTNCGANYDSRHGFVQNNIRVGELIEPPDTRTNEIE